MTFHFGAINYYVKFAVCQCVVRSQLWLCECVYFEMCLVSESKRERVRDQVEPKLFIIPKFVNGFLTFVSIRRHFHLSHTHFSDTIWSSAHAVSRSVYLSLARSLAHECVYEYENIIWLLQFQPQIAHCTKTHSPFIHSFTWLTIQSLAQAEMFTHFSLLSNKHGQAKMNCRVAAVNALLGKNDEENEMIR